MFLIGVQVVRINLISKMAGDMDHAHLFAILAGLACVVGIGGQGARVLTKKMYTSLLGDPPRLMPVIRSHPGLKLSESAFDRDTIQVSYRCKRIS
jgi:hypothetical protein